MQELSGNEKKKIRKRTRTIQKLVLVTEDENNLIHERMLTAGTTNFSAYARKMLIDGYVVHHDFSELKELTRQIAGIARNVNQVAHRANESRSVSPNQVEELMRYFYEIKRAVSAKLVDMMGADDGYC